MNGKRFPIERKFDCIIPEIIFKFEAVKGEDVIVEIGVSGFLINANIRKV